MKDRIYIENKLKEIDTSTLRVIIKSIRNDIWLEDAPIRSLLIDIFGDDSIYYVIQIAPFLAMEMERRSDPKYLGIPNICFSQIDEDDKREPSFRKDRLERGFDESELWSLDNTIAEFILPRLKEYLNVASNIIIISEDQKKKIINSIQAFDLISKFEDTGENDIKIDKGLRDFFEIFRTLWY